MKPLSYVINLQRRPDRLQKFRSTYPGAINDVEVVYGFDGQSPNDPAHSEQEMARFGQMSQLLTSGEKGCFLSHMRVMQRIVDSGAECAIIMEDDVQFSDDYISKLDRALSELPTEGVDILFIGGRFTKDYVMKESSGIPFSEHIVKTRFLGFNDNWDKTDHNRTAHCYMVSNRCARTLLEIFAMKVDQVYPYDFWNLVALLSCGVTIYNTKPLLCYSDLVGDSDIR